jgi:uncharacterized protein with HEPN domain
MARDDRVFLRHMLDAAQKAKEFINGRSRNVLDSGEMLALAVVRLLEVLGEAARSVSQEFKNRLSEITWKQISGTRDRLIHGYFDVDHDIIWAILTRDLPPLITQREKLLTLNETNASRGATRGE